MSELKDHPSKTKLLVLLHVINDLESAANVLMWDQSTYMPTGGAAARARQSATLRGLANEKLIDPSFGEALAEFESYTESLPYGSDDAALARVVRRNYDRESRVPAEFQYEFAEHTAACFSAWALARPANDFKAIQPYLEKTLELSRRYADYFPEKDHPADAHIDRFDYGMSVATIQPIFADLREFLTPFVQRIHDTGLEFTLPESAVFSIDKQVPLNMEVAEMIGYDFSRGRLDVTHHPFTIEFGHGDVRITTRYYKENFAGLFGTMHEAGHAMYEQGINTKYDRTPLDHGTSSAVHESQSRSWENLVGRSKAFWKGYYPKAQEYFPELLGDFPMESFYKAVNRVHPSLIRVEADEVTYALHIIIRFELEMALLDGSLSIAELPEAWNAKYREYLGVTPQNDRDGVMQDVHWYTDSIGGMFQGYQLGNVLASQFYAVALQDHPEIPAEIETGKFFTLLNWFTEHIYQYGSKYTTMELVERITGRSIDTAPYKKYLTEKFEDIYGLA